MKHHVSFQIHFSKWNRIKIYRQLKEIWSEHDRTLTLAQFPNFFFYPLVLEKWSWGSPHIHDYPTTGQLVITGERKKNLSTNSSQKHQMWDNYFEA